MSDIHKGKLRACQIFTKKSWGHVRYMSPLKDALVHSSWNGISTNNNKECHKMRNRPWSEKNKTIYIQIKKIPRNSVITMFTFSTKSQIVLHNLKQNKAQSACSESTKELISARKTSHMHNNKGCTSGVVYIPCIYSHARWELPWETQVFAVVFVWHLLSAN